MDSKFVIAIRKAKRNLPPPYETVRLITDLRCELQQQIEEVILRNERIGRQHLLSTIKEIQVEKSYIDAVVKNRIKKIESDGKEYDNNSRELAYAVDDALIALEKLWKIYFEGIKAHDIVNQTTTTQNANKIYNINRIDNANFS